MTTFGATLRRARERAGLTSDDAARRIGISMPNYSAWENDRRLPPPERQAFALAQLRIEPAPPELAEILARYQGELAEIAARFGADLLRAADEPRFRFVADALTRQDAAADRAATARAAAGLPPLTVSEREALQSLESSATAPPASAQARRGRSSTRRRTE